MNADLLKRIVRAMSSGSRDDLDLLARKLIDAERKSGHVRVANELDAILKRSRRPSPGSAAPLDTGVLRDLPVSRRGQEALVTLVPADSLEHHMVLPAATEARFCRIEREYAARERLSVFGLRYRRTVLLYGPPGCGKSLGAKRLAWNTGLPLMKVRFDALLSSYFGESLSNLRAIFDAARATPCVLLLDECDFIARSRNGSKDVGEASRVVNLLLQLMEEFEGNGLLVATTNLDGVLDEAMFRRFDEVLQVPPPGPEQVEQLLRLTLSGVSVTGTVDWSDIVASLHGQSAAQVVKVAQDAAKAALLGGEQTVEEWHLRSASAELHRPAPGVH